MLGTWQRHGYTIVELMVTIVIVAILAATVGVFVTKLLTLQEQDREEAYIREYLLDVCEKYADYMSVGTFVSISNQAMIVKYRQEAGGISLETGIVSHAAFLSLKLKESELSGKRTVNLNVYKLDPEGPRSMFSRSAYGDATLVPLKSDSTDMVSCTFEPFGMFSGTLDSDHPGYVETDAALGRLRVSAQYKSQDENGDETNKNVSVERVVRLWNHE